MTLPTTEIDKAKPALEPGSRWKHEKTGHAYGVVGVGRMQSADWETRRRGLSVSPVSVDMREVVIYRDRADGPIWVRPRDEFEDGRFEALSALQAPSAPAEMGGVEWVAALARGYELMQRALYLMAGTSGPDTSWYRAKSEAATKRVVPLWGLTQTSNESKPGDCLTQADKVVEVVRSALIPSLDAEKDEIARPDVQDKINKLREDLATKDGEVRAWIRMVTREKQRADAAGACATELEGQVAALVEGLEDIYRNVDRWNSLQISSRIRALLARIQPALNGHSNDAGRE